ncbi:MAG TPA: hypothetical protein PKH93_07865, partial [Chitinophagales bacterium]|nr:hypothetical protein [Chitinophagales bacterium]
QQLERPCYDDGAIVGYLFVASLDTHKKNRYGFGLWRFFCGANPWRRTSGGSGFYFFIAE